MLFLLACTGVLLLVTLVLAVLLRVILALLGRKPARFWRRTLQVHVALLVVHLFGTVPATLGWFGSRLAVRTRHDENTYAGPRIDGEGKWVVQSRRTLAAEEAGEAEVAPELRACEERATVQLRAEDGVRVRGFFVPSKRDEPRCSVVVVHGLFRGGLEIDPVAAMFRDLGAEVLMLELRNHGASERAPATFGLYESLDVLAAVRWLRDRPEGRERKIVLFGVSLGTAAVSLAAARTPDLDGLVLDAPMSDLLETAHAMLGMSREGRRSLAMPRIFRTLIFTSLELWSGFAFRDVRPRDALLSLRPDVPVLFIAAGLDQRMPVQSVQSFFDMLPTRHHLKNLWICPDSDHGKVWSDDPEGYRRQLAEFLVFVEG